MTTAAMDLRIYKQSLWGTLDRVSRNCLLAAAVLGCLVIFTVLVAPTPPPRELTIQDMPERFARLILEKPKPAPVVQAPAPSATFEAPPQKIAQAAPPKPVAEVAQPKPKPRPERRLVKKEVAPDKGQQGRQKAKAEVTQNLAEVSGSLDKVLGELSQALPTSGATDNSRNRPNRRQRRGVRSGRSGVQLEAVNNVVVSSGADIQGSAVASEGISIASITDLESEGASGGGAVSATGGTGSGGGEIRSNQTLLAVVRRYAPGIQFCYENELKKSPGLRGKMIVSLTVEPDGRVSNVVLVEDTLRSAAVSDCVLAQMQGWKFPAIETGIVTFKTPFVFTPPE